MSQAVARWGDQVAVERIGGVPFRMYVERPRRLEQLLAFAGRWGSRPHVVQGERVLTFDDFRRLMAAKTKDLVRLGVGPGERVGVMGWNSADYVVNFWAVLAAGAVPVLVNTWWSEAEVAMPLSCCVRSWCWPIAVRRRGSLPAGRARHGKRILKRQPRLLSMTSSAGEASSDENEPAVIIFTSGTSGRPKAVVLSHRALLANLQMLLHMTRKLPQQLDDTSADVALHTGPLFHIGGAQGMMRGLTVGNTLVLPAGRFDPGEALALIEQWKITRWAAVPTMVSRLLDHPDVHRRNLRSLRAVTLGGAPLARRASAAHPQRAPRRQRAHRHRVWPVRERWPGHGRVRRRHHRTAGHERTSAAAHRDQDRSSVPGCPMERSSSGRQRRCRAITVRPHRRLTTKAGSAPAISAAWMRPATSGSPGDRKDLIIRGGENVAPAAVEQALVAAPGVRDAVVFGLAHRDLGEEVAAVIVVDEGYAAAAIEAHVRMRVASFAVPTWWRFQTEPLPVNPTGKVDKPAVVAQVRAALAEQRAS